MNGIRRIEERRNDDGSIVLMILVMLVVTGLLIATLATVEQGLRTSRRSGDSANALQIADAGINDALQAAPTVAGSSFTRTGSFGDNGSYTYTATRDPGQRPVWHIDAIGTDNTGVKRRIKADAVANTLFNTPLFVNSTMDLSSGVSLDSFSSGVGNNICTKKGVIATNDPDDMSFGSSGGGGGVTNCQDTILGNGWNYSMDGCTSYGDGTQNLPPTGPGKCPVPPGTFRTIKDFHPPEVVAPTVACSAVGADPDACYDVTGTTMTCPSATYPSLDGGKVYSFTTVNLEDGCRVINPVLSGGMVDFLDPVVVYAERIRVGTQTGGADTVNSPPTGASAASVCGGTAVVAGNDGESEPRTSYCPGWSGGLRLRVLSGVAGAQIEFQGSNSRFWGAMEVPTGVVILDDPGITVWGAVVSNSAESHAQFTWHFDDSLTQVTTTQFVVQNWREEALGS